MDLSHVNKKDQGAEETYSKGQNQLSDLGSAQATMISEKRHPDASTGQSQDDAFSHSNSSSEKAVKDEQENLSRANLRRSHCPQYRSSDSDSSVKSDKVVKDKEEECERADGEKLSKALTFSQNPPRQQGRPGVILLGRGNSFSLGRSEVILLHRNRNGQSKLKSNFENNNNNSSSKNNNIILENSAGEISVDSQETAHSGHNMNSQLNPTPPPISQGAQPGKMTNGVQHMPGGDFEASELEMLWKKAELIMAAKQSVVQQVLEEFGIGEAGGEGREEEDVWQVVQDSFQV